MQTTILELEKTSSWPLTKQHLIPDRIRGLFLGANLGEALGAPHEFHTRKYSYTGKLEYRAYLSSRHGYNAELAVGAVTDDAEMTLALLNSILATGSYKWSAVVESYIVWANADSRWIGLQTRALFKGIKTLTGYQNRRAKMLAEGGKSQSNGSLMRIMPLVLFDSAYPAIQDCLLTNFNPVNVGCSVVYYYAVRGLWLALSRDKLYELLRSLTTEAVVNQAIEDAWAGRDRDISGKDKGWVVHSLWAALYSLFQNLTFTKAMEFLVHHRGDTDTNMRIAGALLGARDGEKLLLTDDITRENARILHSAAGPTGYPVTGYPRPVEYTLYKFTERLDQLERYVV